MLRGARQSLAGFSNVKFLETTFEALPTDRAAFRLIIAAQSWHWVSPEVRFLKSCRGAFARRFARCVWTRSSGIAGAAARSVQGNLSRQIKANGVRRLRLGICRMVLLKGGFSRQVCSGQWSTGAIVGNGGTQHQPIRIFYARGRITGWWNQGSSTNCSVKLPKRSMVMEGNSRSITKPISISRAVLNRDRSQPPFFDYGLKRPWPRVRGDAQVKSKFLHDPLDITASLRTSCFTGQPEYAQGLPRRRNLLTAVSRPRSERSAYERLGDWPLPDDPRTPRGPAAGPQCSRPARRRTQLDRKRNYDREGEGSRANLRDATRCRSQAFALPCRHDDEGKKAAHDFPLRRCCRICPPHGGRRSGHAGDAAPLPRRHGDADRAPRWAHRQYLGRRRYRRVPQRRGGRAMRRRDAAGALHLQRRAAQAATNGIPHRDPFGRRDGGGR